MKPKEATTSAARGFAPYSLDCDFFYGLHTHWVSDEALPAHTHEGGEKFHTHDAVYQSGQWVVKWRTEEMTDPAETHTEMEAEERTARRRQLVHRQLEHLVRMVQDTGFGNKTSYDWIEREIHRHLEAAYQLLLLQETRYDDQDRTH
jgi:hypothetical protein